MHILIGLAVVALVICGVLFGSLFACVFASLVTVPVMLLALAMMNNNPNAGGPLLLVSGVLTVFIWLPRYYRNHGFHGLP